MSRTVTVEGDMATVDARAALTTQGSVTTPSIIVPAGMNKIDKIIVAASSEGLADGASIYFIRIGGNAVQGGEQNIVQGGHGRIAVQSGSDAAPAYGYPLIIENADIAVTPSDTLSIWAEMAGVDTGTGHAVVTLIFG